MSKVCDKTRQARKQDFYEIKMLAYNLSLALKAIQNLTPEAKQTLEAVISKNGLPTIKDIESLAKLLQKIPFSE